MSTYSLSDLLYVLCGRPVDPQRVRSRILEHKTYVDIEEPPVPDDNFDPAESPVHLKTQRGVLAAINAGLAAGLSHTAAIEILRDLAGEIERGEIAQDPWGPEDSRPPELREAILETAKAQRRRWKRPW